MEQFEPEGKRKEGEIRADSLDTAIQKLSANGQMVISLKEVDDTFDFLGPFIDEIQLSIEKAKNRIPLSNIVFFKILLSKLKILNLFLFIKLKFFLSFIIECFKISA